MQQIKMVVLDLDGTLLKDDKTVGIRTIDALQKLHERGILIVFASGRTNFMMKLYQQPYIPCDYHISFNGAMIEALQTQEEAHPLVIKREIQDRVWQYLADQASAYTAYTKEKMYYFEKNTDQITKKIENYLTLANRVGFQLATDIEVLAEQEIEKDPNCEIIKFVAYEKDQAWIDEFLRFLEQIPSVKSEATGYGVTGVFDVKVSKKDAIHDLCKKLGIKQNEVCAFGDYDNDLSMFDIAGLKVAVDNASPKLKEQADFICPENNADGVAVFIEEHLL